MPVVLLIFRSGSQNSLYFPCPGRSVPITVHLIKRKLPGDVDSCGLRISRKSHDDRHSVDVLQHDENSEVEVRDSSRLPGLFISITRPVIHRFLQHSFFNNGNINLPGKSFVVHFSCFHRIAFFVQYQY